MTRRLERNPSDKVIAGICGGLARYLQLDSTLIRAVFVISTLMSAGLFLLGYIALLFFMPLPGQSAPIDEFLPQGGRPPGPASPTGTSDAGAELDEPRVATDHSDDERRQRWIGYALIALGVIFLIGEAGVFRFVRWDLIWPVALIGVGLYFVLRRGRW